jgi:Hsp70 protein
MSSRLKTVRAGCLLLLALVFGCRPPSNTMSTSRGILDEAVGIETLGGTFTPLISQGVELPTSFADNFSTGADNQNAVQLTFQAGTSTNDARVLGMFIINQIAPAPRGIPRIRVTVSVEPMERFGSPKATARPA